MYIFDGRRFIKTDPYVHTVERVKQQPIFPREFEWWARFKKGNLVAFKTLLDWYGPLLFSFGTHYTDDTELVTNGIRETFLELWQNREVLSPTDGMKIRLMQSLYHRIYRTPNDRETARFSIEFRLEESLAPDGATEVIGQLKALLHQLTRPEQEVVYLKFFQELSCDEIAEVTNCSVQTVADRLQTAIRYVRTQWKVVFSSQSPNIERLLWNESFRKWVLKPTPESDSFWHCWRMSNPERLADLKLARTVVLALQVHDRQLSEFELHYLITQTLSKVPAQPANGFFSVLRWQPVSWPAFTVLYAMLSKRFRKNKASLS